MTKRNLMELYTKEDDLSLIFNEFKKRKIPTPLMPIFILFLELYSLKDFFEKNQKLIVVFGVFGGLTVYMNFNSKVSYFSFVIFFLTGILLFLEVINSKRLLLPLFGTLIFGGLIYEVFVYMISKYSNYLKGLLVETFLIFVGALIGAILIFAYIKLKKK